MLQRTPGTSYVSTYLRGPAPLNTALGCMKSGVITFTSASFATSPDEDAETNPGIFGRGLAAWLSRALEQAGASPGGIIAEDYGWCVPVASSPHKTYVACASSGEAPHEWSVFVFAEGGLLGRLLGKDTRGPDVERVFGLVQSALSNHPDVHSLRVDAP